MHLCRSNCALRANIDETVLLVVITEQGENRNQCEEQRNLFGFPNRFAIVRTTEPLRLPPRLCPPRNVGRPSGARPPGVHRRAKPSRPSRPPCRDRTRRLSPAPSDEPSPPSTNCASWLRRTPLPHSPAPSAPCNAAKDSIPRTWSPGVASDRPAFSRA